MVKLVETGKIGRLHSYSSYDHYHHATAILRLTMASEHRLLPVRAVRRAYVEELAFFKRFHLNRVNWIIHAVTIPVEWTATLIILSVVGLHWHVAIATGLYHLVLGSRVSVQAAVAQIVFGYFAHYLSSNENASTVHLLCIAMAMNGFAWFAQVVVGHWMFEGNSPAMATKLTANSVVLSVILAWDSY